MTWKIEKTIPQRVHGDNAFDGGPPKRALGPPAAPKETACGLRDFGIMDPRGHSLVFGPPLEEQQ